MRRYDRRGVSFASTLDGTVAISGFADEVSGALLQTAVDAASPLVVGDSRTAAQRRLDGLVDVARHYLDTIASRQDGPHRPALLHAGPEASDDRSRR